MGILQWLGVATTGRPLEVGDPAPDAIAPDERGRERSLAEFYHDGYTLVYFYPKADTPGCAKQACSLRDGFDGLKAMGVTIVGVSADRSAAQLKFQEKFRLPFTLLADEEGKISRAFGVPTLLGFTHRQSFLIRNRRVVWRDLHASTGGQARDVLQALEKLAP
jgi:peroxiredoxin Q/BCP